MYKRRSLRLLGTSELSFKPWAGNRQGFRWGVNIDEERVAIGRETRTC